MTDGRLLIFFDGKCPFCIGWVKFLIDQDGRDCFRFAALQSDWTHRFFEDHGQPHPGMGSIVVWDGTNLLFQSRAISVVTDRLPGVWRFLRHITKLPGSLPDRIYDFIAIRRYRLFGRRDSYWLPEEAERRKFLDLSDPFYQHAKNGDQTEKPSHPDQR